MCVCPLPNVLICILLLVLTRICALVLELYRSRFVYYDLFILLLLLLIPITRMLTRVLASAHLPSSPQPLRLLRLSLRPALESPLQPQAVAPGGQLQTQMYTHTCIYTYIH